jgi:hypothetical protein
LADRSCSEKNLDSRYLTAIHAIDARIDLVGAQPITLPLPRRGHSNAMRALPSFSGAATFLEQQAKFDDFIDCFNNERPHQALGMQSPAQRYQRSPRPYKGLPDLSYPFHDKEVTVTACGRICFKKRKINLSQVFRQPDRRNQADRRPYLARQLHGL